VSRRAFLGVAALGAVSTISAGAVAAGARGLREASWWREWDDAVAAARVEGRLSLVTWADSWGGPGYGGFGKTARRFERVDGLLVGG
jgi:hypothetical protein